MKAEFVALLEEFIKNCEDIDERTVWSSCEPEWWLHMQTIERQARQHLKTLAGEEPK